MKSLALQRQWSLLEKLHRRRMGLTTRALLEELRTSRATLYRDLRILQDAGFQIASELHNGEVRHRLLGEAMPPVQPTPRQVLALRLARRMLAPLEGTKVIRELDALFPKKVKPGDRTPIVEVGALNTLGEPSIATAAEQAMTTRRRISFMYAATRGAPSLRKVDPLALHVRDGQLYLNAFDVERGALRTFKFARISSAQVLDEKAQPHEEYDEARVFAHAAKIWDGPLVTVVVHISPRGARFVKEWPLVASQQVEAQPDGSAIVRAQVAGTVEAMRWVLRWGKDALVLEPPDLRAAVLEELRRALDGYGEQDAGER